MSLFSFFADSHGRQFVGQSWGNFSFNFYSGATIKGLASTTSVTGHRDMIIHGLAAPFPKIAAMMFGGVDLDFSYYRNACKQIDFNEDVFFEERIEIYREFVTKIIEDECTSRNLSAICILAPHISPVRDALFVRITSAQANLKPEELEDLALRMDTTHSARSKRVLKFNDLLEVAFSDIPRVHFYRIDREMIGSDFCVKDQFVVPWVDHHAKTGETMKLWRPLLSKHIRSYA